MDDGSGAGLPAGGLRWMHRAAAAACGRSDGDERWLAAAAGSSPAGCLISSSSSLLLDDGLDGCLGEAGWRQELKVAVVAEAVSSLYCNLHTSQDLAEAALFCPPLPPMAGKDFL